MLKVALHPCYAHPLPETHRFPMLKYELLPEQLLYEGSLEKENFFEPEAVDKRLITQIHDPNYWQKLSSLSLSPREQRISGFPHSQALIDREVTIMGGTVACCSFALKHGVAMNIAGGTHHAYTNRGEGFCLLNDIALGAQWLLNEDKASSILVVDLDVHQGNGTAEIFANENRVFTFSMHGDRNYPLRKEKSDLDVSLPDGASDATYLPLLEKHLKDLGQSFQPDFIFFQSGVDVLATDKLGRLGLSFDGCKERDRMVLQFAKDNNIPLVAAMGGGYSEDIRIIVDAHANTFRLAQELFF